MSTQVSVYLGSNQATSATVYATIEFDTVLFDDDSEFESVGSYSVSPAATGRFLVTYQVRFSVANADDSLRVQLQVHGTTVVQHEVEASDTGNMCIAGSKVVELSVAGGQILLKATNQDDADNIESGSSNTFMTVSYLGDIP